MTSPRRFEGKVAVVVGGASGHGRATSLRLAQEHAEVFVIDGDEGDVEATCSDIISRGGHARGATAVLDDAKALQEVANQWAVDLGTVHVLVTNYVTLEWGSFEECPIEEFERVVKFTLVGPAAATKVFLPMLKEARGGSIVHIGSIDGLFGNPRAVPYSTAKAGLGPFTRITAREFAQFDIRVNTIATGQTNQVTAEELDTGSYQDSAPSLTATTATSEGGVSRYPGSWYLEQLARATPLKRNGPPEEWAGTIAFLASDDASYVSGSIVTVDCARTGLTTGTFDPEGFGQ
jgi:NAD(P)-dependent dehydrogenase (short-subunit alcohol dehydrogenase family)